MFSFQGANGNRDEIKAAKVWIYLHMYILYIYECIHVHKYFDAKAKQINENKAIIKNVSY